MANSLIGAEVKVIATVIDTHTGTTPTDVDFGTPNDIDLRDHLHGAYHGARVLVVVASTSDGSTDTLTVGVEDAQDDGSGAISESSVATAITDGATGYGLEAAAGGSSIHVIGVQPVHDRPWLRVTLDADGATDAFSAHVTVLALPAGL